MKDKYLYILSTLAFLVIAATMLVPLVYGPLYGGVWYKYAYSAGAAVMLLCSLFSPYRGKDLKLKRLVRMQSWSAIMFCAAAFFLFYSVTTLRDWIAFTLAGAVIRAYSNFAIAARQRKLANDGKK